MSRRERVYLSPPHLTGEEWVFLRDALASNWIAPVGPQVDAFAREFAQTVGSRAATATASGTAALHLALKVVGVRPKDEVLVSTLTFVASVNPIRYVGARPVFIDCQADSWNIDPDLVSQAVEQRVKKGNPPAAVIVVHLYGQPADMHSILQICDRYEIPVVEDAAEALGTQVIGRAAGTLGKVGIFSFNGNKMITTSGGGMLVSDNEALVDRARHLATQAREDVAHYEHVEVGYNYRMSNLLAAGGEVTPEVDPKIMGLPRYFWERGSLRWVNEYP